MSDNSSTLTPTVTSNKKRELTSPDSPPDLKKNRFYSSPVSADTIIELEMSHKSEDISEEEGWMDTGAAGDGAGLVSLEDKHPHVQKELQQPNLNITLKEGDLKGISLLLKESFHGDLRDEMRVEMGVMIKGIVDGVLLGLNERIEALNVKIDSLKTENNTLKRDNEALKSRVSKLETAAEAAEQYSRRNCLRISGYREEQNENTDNIILDITSKLNINVGINEIDRSHRVGRPRDTKPRDIIVKLFTFRARTKLYEARKKLKDNGYNGVFINGDLTKFRSTLLYKSRKLVRERRVLGAWSSNGTVLIKDNTENVHKIMRETDLSPFVNALPRTAVPPQAEPQIDKILR